MKLSSRLTKTLEKKAFGFTYTEEIKEYELAKSKPYLFCEKRNRLYFMNGYIKVNKISGGVEVLPTKKFVKPAKNSKILKKIKILVTHF